MPTNLIKSESGVINKTPIRAKSIPLFFSDILYIKINVILFHYFFY